MKKKSKHPANQRTTESMSLKEGIDAYLKAFRLNRKFDETYIIANWEEIVGPHIAQLTEKLHIYDNKLFIKVSSPALRHELLLSKSLLIEKINETANHEIIKDIILR